MRRWLQRIYTHTVSHSHPRLAGDTGWTFHTNSDIDHRNTGGTGKDSLLACRVLMDKEAVIDIDVGHSALPNWLMPPPTVGERVWKEKMLVGLAELSDLGCHTSLMKAYKAQIRSLGSEPT